MTCRSTCPVRSLIWALAVSEGLSFAQASVRHLGYLIPEEGPMSHAAPESPDDVAVKAALSDRAVSVLRTVVPTLWGAVVTALLAWLSPRVDVELAEQLGTWLPAATGAVTAVVISAWYVLWRVLEPRVPAWLVRIVLGSASTPAYSPPASTS